MSPAPFHVGLLLFPDITQLDMTGPYEVFTRMPGAKVDVHLEDARTGGPRSGAALRAHRHLRSRSSPWTWCAYPAARVWRR